LAGNGAMVNSFDVAVIGGGVMGCAAARALSARKQRVILFEQGRIGHQSGSSHGRSRMIRLAYGQADYIPLCRAAYPAWQRLEEESGVSLLQITGGLDLAFGEAPSWRRTANAMTEAQVPHEVLQQQEIARRFPQFALPDNAVGLFQPQGGVLHADLCLSAFADAARRGSAELREGERVLSVRPGASAIELRTVKNVYRVERLVIAAGGGTGAILHSLGLNLPLAVSKEQVAFFRPRDSVLHGPDRLPIFIFHLGGKLLASGFPLIRDDGLKLMIENKRPAAAGDEGVEPDLLTRLEAKVRQILPGVDDKALRAETCGYTLTPDEDFIIDHHPGDPRIVIVSACSGHGFKFATLFGEAMADLAGDRQPAIDLRPFRIGRPALQTKPRSNKEGDTHEEDHLRRA
jgi:sarcosine oxidase